MAEVKTALVSVSDKARLPELLECLTQRKVRIFSTGGTARHIREYGHEVHEIADYTGEEEILGGRVKTLHPKVFAGILADVGNEEHDRVLHERGVSFFDLVVVNFYSFNEAASAGLDLDAAIEKIDIGGPSMVRAAAKNHRHVAVLTDPRDYGPFVRHLEENDGSVLPAYSRSLALKAFALTGRYDAMIASYFSHQINGENAYPETINRGMSRLATLRYGENPHQQAAIYSVDGTEPSLKQLAGAGLSYNNHLDLDAAWKCVSTIKPSCCAAIFKHGNPCGAAARPSLCDAFQCALNADPLSAFGGVIALNSQVDIETAEAISTGFYELVTAPGYSPEALAKLCEKKNPRVIKISPSEMPTKEFRSVVGGILVQEPDRLQLSEDDLVQFSSRAPSKDELTDLMFAWHIAKHVKSNAVVVVRNLQTVGVGAGQMSRVDSARIACAKATSLGKATGAVAASDGFLPFSDTLEVLSDAGVTALIQPGGSRKDKEIRIAADESNMAMMMTGVRHFLH